ncbi:MAG: hypothetical protein QM667_12535, partial [Asticcacaulis sp.]
QDYRRLRFPSQFYNVKEPGNPLSPLSFVKISLPPSAARRRFLFDAPVCVNDLFAFSTDTMSRRAQIRRHQAKNIIYIK